MPKLTRVGIDLDWQHVFTGSQQSVFV